MSMSDSDNVVDPVQGILKTFRKGTVLTRRICKTTKNAMAAPQMLDIVEPAQALERSLAYSEGQIKDTYQKSVEILGQGYAEGILNDPVVTNKLHRIAIKLMDEILAIDDYIDDPASFDLGTFQRIQRESEVYSGQVIHILGILQQQLLGAGLGLFKLPGHTDRDALPSMRRTVSDRPVSEVSPMQETPAQSFNWPINSEPRIVRTTADIPTAQIHTFTGASYGSYEGGIQVPPLTMRPKRDVEESAVRLIDSREVARQMSENEELLERRRRSRLSFYQDLSSTRQSSLNSTPPTSGRTGHNFTSFILGSPTEVVQSPLPTSRPNSMLLTASNLPQGGQPRPSLHAPVAQDKYSTLPERYDSLRQDSSPSEPMFFGPLDSPPLSSGRQSAADSWSGLATTLRTPSFGVGVVEGKEVVNQLISDPGIIPVNEDHNEPTPASSVQSIDYPMRPDSSFFQYGGFCDGAKMLLKGDKGALITIRKPGVSETFSALISKKCVKCSYEVDFDVYDKDSALDPSGIYTVGDIRFRMRFLSKCHLPAKHTHDPAYACIFCIEGGKTVDDYDATIFFSVSNFFRHLQKHPRPVKTVEGISVLYGLQSDAVDFDIHFKTLDPRASSFCDMATKFAALPTAHATMNHRERSKGFKERDPDGRPTLQFALGARIVGLEYPPRFNGDWCYGYHDGDKGHFPASAICLDPPPAKDDVVMYEGSSISAIAKWDHKPPKDSNGAWLRFSKKERISKIGYPYPEAWCWTGQNAKGKWGIFPASFVTGVAEGADPSSGRKITRQPSADVSKSPGGGMFGLSKFSSHGFQRRNTGEKLSGGSAG